MNGEGDGKEELSVGTSTLRVAITCRHTPHSSRRNLGATRFLTRSPALDPALVMSRATSLSFNSKLRSELPKDSFKDVPSDS